MRSRRIHTLAIHRFDTAALRGDPRLSLEENKLMSMTERLMAVVGLVLLIATVAMASHREAVLGFIA